MRSSPFIILSIAAHIAVIAALVLAPKSEETSIAKTEDVEMAVSQPEPEVAAPEEPLSPAPTPIEATSKPAPPPASAQQPKKPKASVAALLKRQPKSKPTVQENNEEAVQEALDPQTDVTVAAAIPATAESTDDESTEARAEEANTEDPAPVGYSEQNEHDGQDEAHKAGANKQGAVSYLGLKQSTGNKPPAYPVTARRERRQGELELIYRVTHDGLVADVSVAKSSGFQDLDKAAVDAVSKYRFEPGQEGWARHPIAFTLKGPEEELPSKLRTASPQADVE